MGRPVLSTSGAAIEPDKALHTAVTPRLIEYLQARGVEAVTTDCLAQYRRASVGDETASKNVAERCILEKAGVHAAILHAASNFTCHRRAPCNCEISGVQTSPLASPRSAHGV